MEKAINVKTKKVNLMFGFINDENYGVDYTTLVNYVELLDLFPFINQGEVEITKNHLAVALFISCSDLKGSAWDNACDPNPKYRLFMEVRTLKYEPTFDVSFRIVKC